MPPELETATVDGHLRLTPQEVAAFHVELKAALGQDSPIDDKAHAAATSPLNDLPHPSPAQVETGAYKKGHIKLHGHDIAIENPAGSERKGVGASGPWTTKMSAHYGYIKKSNGADGDKVDCFVKPGIAEDHAGPVFVVPQNDHNGNFDEHKCMLGYEDEDEAKAAYLSHYDPSQKRRMGKIEAYSPVDFKRWVETSPHYPIAEPVHLDSYEGTEEPTEGLEVLAADKDGLCRIRQFAMQCDAINANRRVYPRAVVMAAINDARLRARAGAMLSEFEHPAVVDTCDRGKCGEAFVDDPFGKTARVDEIEDPGPDGRVYIVRTVLDTESGRKLKAKIDAREPAGISTRFGMKGRMGVIDGQKVTVADSMTIHTWDDVRNPAVKGAGAYTVLTDSQLEQLFADSEPPERQPEAGLGEPFDGNARNTLNNPSGTNPDPLELLESSSDSPTMRPSAQEPDPTVNKTAITKLLRDFRSKVTAGACADDLNPVAQQLADSIRKAYQDGDEIAEYQSKIEALDADAAEKIPGYVSGKESPFAILAAELGADPDAGWGRGMNTVNGPKRLVNANTSTTPTDKTMLSADEQAAVDKRNAFIQKQMDDEAAANAAKVHADSVDAEITRLLSDEHHPLNKLSEDQRNEILKAVRLTKCSVDSVATVCDALIAPVSKATADARLETTGFTRGQVTLNRADPQSRASITHEPMPFMVEVDRLIAATDEVMRLDPRMADEYGWENALGDSAGAEGERKRRARNMAIAMPIIEQCWDVIVTKQGKGKALSGDSFGEGSAIREAEALVQSVGGDSLARGDSAAYNTLLTNLANQPTIMMWLLMQSFQDLKSLEWCTPVGPGQGTGNNAEGWADWQPFGRVFRVPSETYNDPTDFPSANGISPQDLIYNSENVGIEAGGPTLSWDTFGADWRMIALSNSLQGLAAIGLGPLNYPAIARGLYHMAGRKCRSVDTLLLNEIMNAALEFGAVVVTSEAYTTGGSNGLDLASNSVMPASGLVSVNLNPQKTAVATIASTDKSITYGSTVLAALRLKSGGGGGADAVKGTYFSTNQSGPTPIVPPRSLLTLTGPGADSTSTLNACTVTLPVSQVLGWLDNAGNIQSFKGTTATYAVDWMNGVLVFNTTAALSGSGTVITTSITVAPYSYATNFDYFVLGLNNVNQVTLATGETIQGYYNRLLGRIDDTAAAQGDSPNYVKPDLLLSGMKTSAKVIQATINYKLNSPDGTALMPDETNYARRNGVDLARFNAPCYWKDKAMVMLRRGTTRYAINQPFAIRGPVTLFDTNGQILPGEAYWGAEHSAICTPQVKDGNGVIKNGVSRAILTY